jgi:hexosaminidase
LKLIPLPRHIERSTGTEPAPRLRLAACLASPAVCRAGRIVSALQRLGAALHEELPENPACPFTMALAAERAADEPQPKPPALPDMAELGNGTGSRLPNEGYVLGKNESGFLLAAGDEAGFFYGLQTLRQLMALPDVPVSLRIADWPDMPVRAVHVDLKGIVPRFEYLLDLVDDWASHKINTLLVEYENHIPWPGHPLLEAENRWSNEQLARFLQRCRSRYIRVIPLQQSFGHLHYALKHEAYAHLREFAGYPSDICPSNGEAVSLLEERLHQIMDLHPDAGFVHLGCDETLHLNCCPRCRRQFGEDGKFRNYIHHVNRMAELVAERGFKPIIWDDMLRKMDDGDIARLHRDIAVAVWCYHHKDAVHLELERHLDRYEKLGLTLFGACCGSGADSHKGNLPNFRVRAQNISDWSKLGESRKLQGVFCTNWSRYSSIDAYCEPLPATRYTALLAAQSFWNRRFEPERFDEAFLFHVFGIDSMDPRFAFSLINHGHYETTLYGDPYWLGAIAEKAAKRADEARLLAFLAGMNKLDTTGEHSFERLYFLTLPTATPMEKTLVKGYIEALGARLEAMEKEGLERFRPFYDENDALRWLRSRMFQWRWMHDTALAAWDDRFGSR